VLAAVIFDLDGTLVDSEQYGHRIAFNDAFEAFGLPDRWTRERYRDLLATTGGERRILGWLSSPDSPAHTRPEEERRQLATSLHRWKTDRVEAMAAAGAIPARPGVTAWLDELAAQQIRLAVATTGSRQWALPLLDTVFGVDRFEVVVAGDDVAQRKPHPEAYLRTLARLGLGPTEVVAVEDSGPGWEAARAGGLTTVVVANDETDLATVTGPRGAPLVIDGFGPDARIIEDRFNVMKSGGRVAHILAELLTCATMDT
jgi:HAD superfamily hydrolase (TIGR01509 family)